MNSNGLLCLDGPWAEKDTCLALDFHRDFPELETEDKDMKMLL